MKHRTLCACVAVALCASLTLPSCIGSFGLTNKLLTWNRSLSTKFVNELVFFAFWIVPVYEVSALADILVINSIEFWSGDNPMAHKGRKVVEGRDGDRYLVDCDASGYTVTPQKGGEKVRFTYEASDQSWTMTVGQSSVKIFSYLDATHVSMLQPDGTYAPVELSDGGVQAYMATATASRTLASR